MGGLMICLYGKTAIMLQNDCGRSWRQHNGLAGRQEAKAGPAGDRQIHAHHTHHAHHALNLIIKYLN